KMEQVNYDIVITDIIMPRESGLEMLSNIKEKAKAMQIIIMTGEPTVATAIKAVQNGANDYLIKPINKETLLRTIKRSAEIKTLQDEKKVLEIENQRYQENLEALVDSRTQSLENATQAIISLLSTVVEIRDPYTAGHQRRVGNLAAAIADKMGLNTETVNLIRVVGYIHDIGKIMIPAEILCKPGDLSDLEMQMVRNHSRSGYDMITKVNLPVSIAETIYQHHERCDGSGYPRGLTAKDLTLEASIIIVADVVEAIMSHRPYRPALGVDVALNEIHTNAGRLYNEQVVNVCIDLITNENYQLDELEHKFHFLP
ncbi:MAG: HD domain-containing protein, partial [Firmicutes bacterium]|nr:HD domain-containing protein [Bacillota bacterium]